MEALIIGLNNYLARRAVSHLADDDVHVSAITRSLALFRQRADDKLAADIFEIDLMRDGYQDKCEGLLPYIDVAFYFTQVSTLNEPISMRFELLALRNFIFVLQKKRCNRIIYIARLVDRRFISSIVDLFKEYKLDYTVVLKSSIIGKGSTVDKILGVLARRNTVVYVPQSANTKFKPIAALDMVGWLKKMIYIPHFIKSVVEVGGEQEFNFKKVYREYRNLAHSPKRFLRIPVPKHFARFVYTAFYGVNPRDFEEFRRALNFEYVVDNSKWGRYMPFEFTPLKETLQLDR